jgi:hypothetical protein
VILGSAGMISIDILVGQRITGKDLIELAAQALQTPDLSREELHLGGSGDMCGYYPLAVSLSSNKIARVEVIFNLNERILKDIMEDSDLD